MRRDVNIPIGLIMIAILALLLALGWLFKMEIPKRASERYQNELKAEADLLSRVKPVVHNGVIMLPVLIDGDLKWQRQDAAQVQTATPQAVAQPIDIVEIAAPVDERLGIARQIVTASLAKTTNNNQLLPGSHFKSQKVWQRGVDSLHDRGWVRADNSGTYPAIGHDLNWLLAQIENAMNLSSGLSALPQAMPYEERIKLAGNGNGNTARE